MRPERAALAAGSILLLSFKEGFFSLFGSMIYCRHRYNCYIINEFPFKYVIDLIINTNCRYTFISIPIASLIHNFSLLPEPSALSTNNHMRIVLSHESKRRKLTKNSFYRVPENYDLIFCTLHILTRMRICLM